MPLPFVAYAPSRVSATLNTRGYDGVSSGNSQCSQAILQLAALLETVGWTREDTRYATGEIDFPFGFPFWTDPDDPFIMFGNVLWRPEEVGTRTIHLVTPYQLAHNPPVYEGVHVIVAGNSSAETAQLVAAAVGELWPGYAGSVAPDGTGLIITAVLPGPQWNNAIWRGNGAWTSGHVAVKRGGLRVTSPVPNGSLTSKTELEMYEAAFGAHVVFVSDLFGEWTLAWRTKFTVLASPYQLVIFTRTHADDVTIIGDGDQYNAFFFASAPYIEESLRATVTDCVFVIAGWNQDRYALYHTVRAHARVNGVSRTFESVGQDQGVVILLTHLKGDGGPLLTTGGKALIRTAHLAISKDLAQQNPGETRIVGRPWDCFSISEYHDWEEEVVADGHLWTPINSQDGGGPPFPTVGTIYLALD